MAHAQTTVPYGNAPLFGEVTQPRALKFANAGADDDLLPLEVNGYWGLLNQSRRVIAIPEYDWVDVGVDGLARATLNGKTGFILGNGDWRFDPIYPYADRFEEGYAIIGDDEKFGFLDKAGEVRMEPRLDAALRFREGWAGVRVGDRCGFINTRFRAATPMRFTAVRSFHQGYAAVRLPLDLDDKDAPAAEDADQVETDSAGNSAEPAKRNPSGGAENPDGGTWGYLNKNGDLAFLDESGRIEALGDFNDGLAKFRSGGRWGYMNLQFRVVVPPTYEDARDFTNGSAAVKRNGRWGYINRKFDVVVPFTFDRADDFDDTLAMVRRDGQIGFIDRIGRLVIEPQFTWAEPFRFGVARVRVGDSFGYIRVSGHVFYDPRDAQQGIVDVTRREQLRAQASRWVPYNRNLYPPPRRPTLPAPYPPEYQYDEGLWVGSPPGDTPPAPRPPAPGDQPGETNPDAPERV